ncbi:hypothetical protein D3C84_1229180 [compost metagenome]
MLRVCIFNGTSSCVRPGKPPLMEPSSPTVGRICPLVTVNIVNITMAISGEGILLIKRGAQITISNVSTNRPTISGFLLQKWGT